MIAFRRRSAARAVLVALGAFLATGCPDHHHPPSVWGVASVSPLVPQGWPLSVTMQFSDGGADVSTGRLVLRDAGGRVVLDETGPIDGAAGEGSGMLILTLDVGDAPCGVYTLEVALGDSQGRWSGPASMGFRVVAGLRPGVAYALPGFARAWVALGDLDGDGRRDVAAVEAGGSRVAAWLQTASGTLAAPIVADIGVIARALAAGDVDGDGRAEIVVSGVLPGAPAGTKGRLAVVDLAAGALSVAASLPLGEDEAGPLVLADLDRDGDLDVAVVRESPWAPQLVLLFQSGGALGPPIPPDASISHGGALAAADLDGDGATDLVLHAWDTKVAVLRQTSPGSFAPPELYDLGVMFPSIATGDVNGDGLADALVTGPTGAQALLGRASGPFATASCGGSGVLADVDQDGVVEAVQFTGTHVLVSYTEKGLLLGWQFGLQGPSNQYETAPPGAVAVGDVTGDGKPDVVAAHVDGMLYVVPHR
jgi:FG-GAP-like repeat